jgi:hypothetical protein
MTMSTLSIELEGLSVEVLPKWDPGDSSVGIPGHWEFEVESFKVTDLDLAYESGYLRQSVEDELTSKAYALLEDRAHDEMRGTAPEDWAYRD